MLHLRKGTATLRRVSSSLGQRQRSRPRVEELESRNLLSVMTPGQIRQAYGFNQINFSANGQSIAGDGSGQTIAIVDAYDDPHIQSDLANFDRTFGLPNPVFTKATPEGRPAPSAAWSEEIALDVEWAHAVAPGAKILLVEARSSSLRDLLGAVDFARNQPGVVAVSMSWGSSEFSSETAFDNYFTTPASHLGGSSGLSGSTNLPGGVTFVAAAGDSGGTEWPAVSPNVVSVGGTSLNLNGSGTYGGETSWSGSGGGVSSFENQPAFQNAVQTTGQRTGPDVAYNADPNTGVYVYDSLVGGWLVAGGTSAGAPQWAGLVAIADQGRALAGKGSLDGSSQTLYALYKMGTTSSSAYFHQPSDAASLASTSSNYNLTTGLGSPQANHIAAALVATSGSGTAITIATTTTTAVGKTTTTTTGQQGSTPVTTGSQHSPSRPTSGTSTTNGTHQTTNGTQMHANEQATLLIIVTAPTTLATSAPVTIQVRSGTTTSNQSDVGPADARSGLGLTPALRIGQSYVESGGGDNLAIVDDANKQEESSPPPPPAVPGVPVPPPMPELLDTSSETSSDASPDSWARLCERCFAEDHAAAAVGSEETKPVSSLAQASMALDPVAVVAGLCVVLHGYWKPSTPAEEEARPRRYLP